MVLVSSLLNHGFVNASEPLFLPSCNQTWQSNLPFADGYASSKPPFGGDFPLQWLIAKGICSSIHCTALNFYAESFFKFVHAALTACLCDHMFSRVLVNCVVISLMHSFASANCKRSMFLYPSNLELPCSSDCCCWVSAAAIFAWNPLRVLVSSAVESWVGDHSASNLCRNIPPCQQNTPPIQWTILDILHFFKRASRYLRFWPSPRQTGWPWMWVARVCILVSNWWTIDHRVYPHISCYIAFFLCVHIL